MVELNIDRDLKEEILAIYIAVQQYIIHRERKNKMSACQHFLQF